MLKKVSLVPVSFLCVYCLTAKDFWVERPFTEWSQREAIKMLTKSPWSLAQTVRYRASLITGPSPAEPRSGCETCPSEAESVPATLSDPRLLDAGESRASVSQRTYFVRFQTATPVRMALARLAVLSGNVTGEKAQEYLEDVEFPGQIVVVMEPASGQDTTELDRVTFSYLKEHAYLLLKKSKTRVPLQQYVTPSQFGGSQAFFIFPREENEQAVVSLDEGEVRFVCHLNSDTKIERKFKLKDMLYRGVLDL